jgi:hypothetical protein
MAELPFLITALDRHTRLSARGQKDRYRLICTEPSSIASRRGRHMTALSSKSKTRLMSAFGTNAKYRLVLKLSAYRAKPEVIGAQSE